MPKFDYIIQNPPYKRSLHLEFFNKCIDFLNDKGQMIIIEPSQWLTNIRHTNKLSEEIKEKINGHVKSIIIENLNKEFNIANYTLLSISNIDFSKEYKEINFKCCGEEKIITNLNDANLVGTYKVIKSILDKCVKFDVMKNHKNKLDNFYLRYTYIISSWASHGYFSAVDYVKHKCGTFYCTYISPTLHKDDNKIYLEIPKTKNGNISLFINGTKEELENWKYYILNNKLPLFINICMTIDQHNNSENYVPWLVDRKYTDEEIYKKLDLNQEEIDLIDKTIKKYEINSNFYKNMALGKTLI